MTAIGTRPIRHIALVGTGTIGVSFTAYFLARGYSVSATDPAQDAEAKLRQYLERVWPQLREIGATALAAPSAAIRNQDRLDVDAVATWARTDFMFAGSL